MFLIKFLYTNFPKQYGMLLALYGYLTLPIKLFLFKSNIEIFFGNKDQDKWVVKEIMNYKKNGFFVDLAATDGVHENNTFFLEKKLHWKGICIEPNKKFFKKLKKNRNASCFCEVIDNKVKEINFFPNKGIGGIIGDEYDNNYKKREKILNKAFEEKKIEKRKTKTLKDILLACNAPKVIDYLSLDVEGAEENIIEGFPFDEYKILSMTIERSTPKINKILKENDMLFVKNYKVDSFYVNKILKENQNIKFEKFYQIGKKQW